MRLAPMLILALVFLFMAVMIAEAIGLERSGFRSLFVLAWTGLGLLCGWRISMSHGGQR